MRISATFFVLLLLAISCSDEKTQPSRTFHLGFTPFPYDISLDAVEETYSNITTKADIINHHFDNGVPWIEALSGEPFSDNIMNDWSFRKTRTPSNQKVYLSVAALNPDRNGLALYRGSEDNMILPSPWNTYSFSSIEVKNAYVNYCKKIIDYFDPDYFNMSIEANLLHFIDPSEWAAYVEFHEHVYTALKPLYPNLPIFCSITGAQLLENYFDGNDVSLQRLAALQILEHSDMYALSFYPHMSRFLGNPYPENSFKELFKISAKPLAIAETGYPAQSFNIDMNGFSTTIESDENKQKLFTDDLLRSANEGNAVFVIWFTYRDYDQLWEDIGGKEDITIAWRDCGVEDEQGRERASSQVWKDFLARPLQ